MSDLLRRLIGERIAMDGMSPAQRDFTPSYLPGMYDLMLEPDEAMDFQPHLIPPAEKQQPPQPGNPYYEHWQPRGYKSA